METIFINSIDDLFIRKNIKFTLINLMHETLKLYIPYNGFEFIYIKSVSIIYQYTIVP